MSTSTYEHLLFVGTGAVKDSWDPIIKAIKSVARDGLMPGDGPEGANLYLASVVYKLRRLYWQRQNRRKEAGSQNTVEDSIGRLYQDVLSEYKNLKIRISERLREAQSTGEIHLRARDAFRMKLSSWGAGEGLRPKIFTTNWDRCLDDSGWSNDPVEYIHGSIETPSELYLPSEMYSEPHRSEDGNESKQDKLHELHRDHSYQTGKTRSAIVYGLSLSPLDVELCHWITALARHCRDIIVVDVNPVPVAQRLRFFGFRGDITLKMPPELGPAT